VTDDILTPSEQTRYQLSERLESQFEERAIEIEDAAGVSASFWSDLLNTALGRVNWREIAASMLQDAELEGYEPHKG
jgi:hypothetical protein